MIYTVGSTIPAGVLGLLTALLLNQKFRFRRVFRTLILLPWAVPTVVASFLFLWVLNASYGVLNYILKQLHIISSYIPWLASPHWALVGVIIPTVWKSYPFFCLLILAALQTIPAQLYEAAAVDGAGAWARFRAVTWPGISPAVYLAAVLQAWAQTVSLALSGSGRPTLPSILYGVEAVLHVTLGLVLASHFGAVGMAEATLITVVVMEGMLMLPLVYRQLGDSLLRKALRTVRVLGLPALVTGALAWVVGRGGAAAVVGVDGSTGCAAFVMGALGGTAAEAACGRGSPVAAVGLEPPPLSACALAVRDFSPTT